MLHNVFFFLLKPSIWSLVAARHVLLLLKHNTFHFHNTMGDFALLLLAFIFDHFRSFIKQNSEFAFRRRRLPWGDERKAPPDRDAALTLSTQKFLLICLTHICEPLCGRFRPLRVYASRGTMVINSSLICVMGLLPADAAESPAEEEVHSHRPIWVPERCTDSVLRLKTQRVKFGSTCDFYVRKSLTYSP